MAAALPNTTGIDDELDTAHDYINKLVQIVAVEKKWPSTGIAIAKEDIAEAYELATPWWGLGLVTDSAGEFWDDLYARSKFWQWPGGAEFSATIGQIAGVVEYQEQIKADVAPLALAEEFADESLQDAAEVGEAVQAVVKSPAFWALAAVGAVLGLVVLIKVVK